MHKLNFKPNILFISFDGLSDPLGQSQILPYLFGLSKNYNITIISCEKKERLEKEKNNIISLLKTAEINWEFIYFEENTNLFSKYNYSKSLKKLALKIIITNDIKLIHCRSYPAANLGLYFYKKFNIPFVFDMRGFWADERLEGKIWKKSNPLHLMLYLFFKAKEKKFFNQASHIVSLTHKGKSIIENKFKINNNKITVIPCCVDLEMFKPISNKIDIKQTIGFNENDKLLIYIGSVGTWYLTNEVINCFKVWHNQNNIFKLLILTKDNNAINELIHDLDINIKNAIKSISVSHNLVPSYLSLACASIFFIKNSYSKQASSPTKMAESWAMNVPIITNAGIGDNDIYFNQNNGGVLINNFSNDAYLKAYNDFLNLNKNNFRSIAEKDFNHLNGIEKYNNIYNLILNASKNN